MPAFDDLAQSVWDAEVALAAAGVFVLGVEPPLEHEDRPVIAVASDDPQRAATVIADRFGEAFDVDVEYDALYYVQPHPISSWHESSPGQLDVRVQVPPGVRLIEIKRFEDAATIVLVAFVIWPIGVKASGYPTHRADITLSEPVGDRNVIDGGARLDAPVVRGDVE